MNLLHRRLKSLRVCKTNQLVVSGKNWIKKKVISLKVYRRASPQIYNPTNACFRRSQHPQTLPLSSTPHYLFMTTAHRMHANVTVHSSIALYRPLSPSVYMMQRIATQKATAKSPKRLHAWMFYATTKTLDSHTLVQLINGISTDIDILCEQLIRHLVFLQDVVIRPRAREGRPEQEAEHPAAHGGTKSALRAGARGLMITLGPVLGAVRFG